MEISSILYAINAVEYCTIDLNFSIINCSTAWNSFFAARNSQRDKYSQSRSGRMHKRIFAELLRRVILITRKLFIRKKLCIALVVQVKLIELFYAWWRCAYLLQLFSGEPLLLPSTAPEPGLKKFSLKNFKKCGRFLIKLLLTSFSFSLIWLSSSMLVAFDFDLNAVVGGAPVNVDEPRQALCVPNNPIMSNSCTQIESDRCRMWLSKFLQLCALHYYNDLYPSRLDRPALLIRLREQFVGASRAGDLLNH